jgi:hypothetical protein
MKTAHWTCGGGRDIYAKGIECDCPRWPDSDVLAHYKKELTIPGYADHNFFHNVKTTKAACSTCGVTYQVTWYANGTIEYEEEQ